MAEVWPSAGWDAGGSASSLVGRICTACIRSVPVTGASLSLMTGAGNRATVHASDAVAARLEDLHFDMGEGPGLDAFREGQPVLVADLDDPRDGASARWPGFSPAAYEAGARAVFAYPLALGAAKLGVLLLYGDRAGALDADARATALRLADGAFFALLDLLSGSTSAANGDGDREWFGGDNAFYRAEVYQAAGMLTVRLGVGIEEAMVRLRAYAFAHDRPVSDVAADIVGRNLHLRDDNDGSGSARREQS